jgi:hypothetical protein
MGSAGGSRRRGIQRKHIRPERRRREHDGGAGDDRPAVASAQGEVITAAICWGGLCLAIIRIEEQARPTLAPCLPISNTPQKFRAHCATLCSVEDYEDNLSRRRAREPSNMHHAGQIRVGLAMQDPLRRAYYYRQKAMECHELAKYAQLAFLAEFYRRHAVSYMFMAEEVLNEGRARGEVADEADRRATRSHIMRLIR